MEHLLKAIVRVHSYGKPVSFTKPFVDLERVASVGTGTFVNPGVLGFVGEPDMLYILTCAHVIEQADQVTIVLPLKGSEQLPASVLAFVPQHSYDLAIVALPNRNGEHNPFINTLPLGSSKKLQQGEKLVALGFPMGQTGLKLSDGVFAGMQHFLQHTVSISPGNSGGPLINSAGELVGINNAGLIHVAASNIGYAVPIEFYLLTAARFYSKTVGPPSPDRVLREPNFGFFLQPTTTEHVRQVATVSSDGCCANGMFIFEVVPESPAFVAGVQPGDFLCAAEGRPVDNTGDIQVTWSAQKVPIKTALQRLSDPSRSYTFTIWSHTQRACRDVQLTPQVLDRHVTQFLYSPFDRVDYVDIKGFIVMPLCRNHQNAIETLYAVIKLKPVHRFEPHLVITHVVPGSPADLSETFSSGDLLTHVNQKPVLTLDDVRQAVGPRLILKNDRGKTTVL